MLSVVSSKKEGFRFYFVLKDGDKCFGGGLREDKFLVCDPACTEKELMLRTLINKCMNDFVSEVYARGDWGTDLARFGFEREGDVYRSSRDKLRLRCAPYNDRAQHFYHKYGFAKVGEEAGGRVPLEILEKYIGYDR